MTTRDANKEVKTSTMVEGGWVGDKMLRLIGLVLMKCEHAHTHRLIKQPYPVLSDTKTSVTFDKAVLLRAKPSKHP